MIPRGGGVLCPKSILAALGSWGKRCRRDVSDLLLHRWRVLRNNLQILHRSHKEKTILFEQWHGGIINIINSGCSVTAHYTLKAWTKEKPPKTRPGLSPGCDPARPGVDCAAPGNILLFITWSAPLRARGHSRAEICSHNCRAIRTQISSTWAKSPLRTRIKPGLELADKPRKGF